MFRFLRCCMLGIALVSAASAPAEEFFFRDGDVVVMIGDSITEQHLYSNYVEMWTVTSPQTSDAATRHRACPGGLIPARRDTTLATLEIAVET